MSTPLGNLLLTASCRGLRRIRLCAGPGRGGAGSRQAGPAPKRDPRAVRHLERAMRELKEYFAGERRSFRVPLDLKGTPRQHRLWEALRKIPFGETIPCEDLARRLGSPAGTRSVARSCALNPVPVIIPSHRLAMGPPGTEGTEEEPGWQRILQDLEERRSRPESPLAGPVPESIPREGRARTRFRTSSAGGRYRP